MEKHVMKLEDQEMKEAYGMDQICREIETSTIGGIRVMHLLCQQHAQE